MIKDFFGADLTDAESKALCTQNIAPKLIDIEPSLVHSKWFDYRFMCPTKATYLFAAEYKKAMQRSMVRRSDIYRGNSWAVFPKQKNVPVLDENGEQKRYQRGKNAGKLKFEDVVTEDIFKCPAAYITTMWKARQMADRHGVPYHLYIAGAAIYHERMKWQNYPLPAALYSDVKRTNVNGEPTPSMLDGILSYWQTYRGCHVMASDLPAYKAENFEGDPHQLAHIKYLMNQLAASSCPVFLAAELVYERGLLKEEWVTKKMGLAMVASAEKIYISTIGERP